MDNATRCSFQFFCDTFAMKKGKPKRKAVDSTVKDDQLNFRIASAEKESFKEAAHRDGFDQLSTWLLWLARQRAKDTADSP